MPQNSILQHTDAMLQYTQPPNHEQTPVHPTEVQTNASQKGPKKLSTGAAQPPPAERTIENPVREPLRKRKRIAFTADQVLAMEEVFKERTYIVRQTRAQLHTKIGVPEKNIKIWFQNRRMKEKKTRRTTEQITSCRNIPHSTSSSPYFATVGRPTYGPPHVPMAPPPAYSQREPMPINTYGDNHFPLDPPPWLRPQPPQFQNFHQYQQEYQTQEEVNYECQLQTESQNQNQYLHQFNVQPEEPSYQYMEQSAPQENEYLQQQDPNTYMLVPQHYEQYGPQAQVYEYDCQNQEQYDAQQQYHHHQHRSSLFEPETLSSYAYYASPAYLSPPYEGQKTSTSSPYNMEDSAVTSPSLEMSIQEPKLETDVQHARYPEAGPTNLSLNASVSTLPPYPFIESPPYQLSQNTYLPYPEQQVLDFTINSGCHAMNTIPQRPPPPYPGSPPPRIQQL